MVACEFVSEFPQSASVSEICTEVLECGGFGFDDAEMCEADWLGSEDLGLEFDCANEAAYLECMPVCLSSDCTTFEDCEAECWDTTCLE
jgi:hypothetical protein